MNQSVKSVVLPLALLCCGSTAQLSTQQTAANPLSSLTETVVQHLPESIKKTVAPVAAQTDDDEHPVHTSPGEKKEDASDTAEQQPVLTPEEELHIYTYDTLSDLTVNHEKTYTFAMVGSFSGHFRLYGTTIRNGILARFRHINKTSGGIHKKLLRLVCVDDHGKPDRTHKIVNHLRKKHDVKTFIGNMGARNTAHILSLVRHKKISLLFPWGASEFTRQPDLVNLVNGLGHMEPQLESLVEYCTQGLRMKKIAIFHSDGTFYTIAKNRVTALLKERGIVPVSAASYNRFTMDITTPADKIITYDPKIVICLGSSQPVAKLISRFFELGHYGTTFIGIDSTMFVPDILRQKGAAYSYSSTVPNPTTSITAIANEYRTDMQEHFTHDVINILSFSYYIHAAIIARALSQLDTPDNAYQRIIPMIETMTDVDLGGFTVSFDKETRHAYQHTVKIIEG